MQRLLSSVFTLAFAAALGTSAFGSLADHRSRDVEELDRFDQRDLVPEG